jgi:hypothetical protein
MGRLRQFPYHRVLTTTRTNHQDFHNLKLKQENPQSQKHFALVAFLGLDNFAT